MRRLFLTVPLIAANTLLAFALAEGAARLAEKIHPGGDQIAFEYSPYRMFKMVRAPWPLNRDGFRAAELESYRGSFLVEFVGGSVCLGVGDHPGATIPERLEGALRRLGLVRTKVLNLCQGGATSAQELSILIEYGLKLHPEAVLSFDGANDVLHPRPIGVDGAPNLPYDNSQLEARVNGTDALTHLALGRVALRLSARLRPAQSTGDPVPIGAIIDSYLYHIALARTLVEAQHADYAVLFQPTVHLDKPWSHEEQAMWRARWPADGASLTSEIRGRYARARAATAEWSASNGVPLYDLTRVFAATTEQVFSDSVHFRGELGYQMLFAELQRQGLIERLRRRYHEWETRL